MSYDLQLATIFGTALVVLGGSLLIAVVLSILRNRRR